MKLLQHKNQEILNVTSSTLCNLILEFSPAKEHILDAGAVDILCELTRHEEMGLRLNGIWALMVKNTESDIQLNECNVGTNTYNIFCYSRTSLSKLISG